MRSALIGISRSCWMRYSRHFNVRLGCDFIIFFISTFYSFILLLMYDGIVEIYLWNKFRNLYNISFLLFIVFCPYHTV